MRACFEPRRRPACGPARFGACERHGPQTQTRESTIAYPPRGRGSFRDQQRNDEPRVNRRIRIREVRVIDPDGNQLGILPTEEALRRAEDMGLDLVEVQPNARPPVCKIMDYGKFKYQQKRKASEAKKNQHLVEVKEVKFRPKTDKHDFDVKVNRLRRFIGEGNKSKVTIMFRGREIVHPEIGQDILRRVADAIADIAMVEQQPRMEGRQMFMVVAPQKGAAQKKRVEAGREERPEERRRGPEVTRAPQVSPSSKPA